MITYTEDPFEDMALALDASADYRVLRRLSASESSWCIDCGGTRTGLFIDTETTGLDHADDEIIELAMVPFQYSLGGTLAGIGQPFEQLRQPAAPLPAVVTALTGITDEMVAGKSIDRDVVSRMVGNADLLLAHNAAFDRRFLERFDDCFAKKPWACSMAQIDWAAEGFEGTKLAYLAMGAGFFYERHRAANDCFAAIELLGRRLPISGRSALSVLLDRARRPQWRIWATNTPFQVKDRLKRRGYRWSGGGAAVPKAWYIDVEEDGRDDEFAFLLAEACKHVDDILCRQITAMDRFSDRV